MLQGLSGAHLILIVFIVVLLFGAPKLPALAKSLGQSMKILKKEVGGSDAEEAPAAPLAPPAAAATAAPAAAAATAAPAVAAPAAPASAATVENATPAPSVEAADAARPETGAAGDVR